MTWTDRAQQIAKLPKWARQEIERLESNIEHLEGQLRKADGTEPTRARIYTLDEDQPRYFDDRYGAIFQLGADPRPEIRTEVRVKVDTDFTGKRALEIRGADMLNVMPASSNVIFVTLARR